MIGEIVITNRRRGRRSRQVRSRRARAARRVAARIEARPRRVTWGTLQNVGGSHRVTIHNATGHPIELR